MDSIPELGRSLELEMAKAQVFLPENFQVQRSLAGSSPRGHKEWDTTECDNTLYDICMVGV